LAVKRFPGSWAIRKGAGGWINSTRHIERTLECLNGVRSLVLGGAFYSVGEIICDLRTTSTRYSIKYVGKFEVDKLKN